MILLSGFEPFDGRTVNRSWEAVKLVEGAERVQLPVDFAKLARVVPELIARRPDAWLLVGEARTRKLGVETIALNVIHAARADNAGHRPQHETVRAGRPLALAATWDGAAVERAIRATGARVEISHHAGTFACNAALYHALDAAAQAGLAARIGLLHVPIAGPALAVLARAIEAVLG